MEQTQVQPLRALQRVLLNKVRVQTQPGRTGVQVQRTPSTAGGEQELLGRAQDEGGRYVQGTGPGRGGLLALALPAGDSVSLEVRSLNVLPWNLVTSFPLFLNVLSCFFEYIKPLLLDISELHQSDLFLSLLSHRFSLANQMHDLLSFEFSPFLFKSLI